MKQGGIGQPVSSPDGRCPKLLRWFFDPRVRESRLLMLTAPAFSVNEQLERSGIYRDIGRENLFGATEEIGQALMQAMSAAESWIADKREAGLDVGRDAVTG